MFKRMIRRTVDWYEANTVSATRLSLFRIVFGLVLLGEIFHLYFIQQLVFEGSDNRSAPFLLLWMGVAVLLIAGYQTRVAVFCNYCFAVATIGSFRSFEYHNDYILMGMSFAILFIPIARNLSVDSILHRWKHGSYTETTVRVSRIYVDFPVFLGIALVYFDSVFYKWASPMWLDGLGVWKPASLPQITFWDSTLLLNQYWLMVGMSHTVLLLESVFIFLMWFQSVRPILLILGLIFHLGITMVYPIPFFGLTMLAIYLLMVPDSWLERVGRKVRFSKPIGEISFDQQNKGIVDVVGLLRILDFRRQFFYRSSGELTSGGIRYSPTQAYDTENSKSEPEGMRDGFEAIEAIRRDSVIARIAFWLRPVGDVDEMRLRRDALSPTGSPIFYSKSLLSERVRIACLIVLFPIVSVLQLFCIALSPSAEKLAEWGGIDAEALGKLRNVSRVVEDVVCPYTGIHPHPVFLHVHFDDLNHAIAIVYTRQDGELIWLPLIRQSGLIGSYNTGRIWVNWTFRSVGVSVDRARLGGRAVAYSRFWATKNGVSLGNADFLIKAQYVDVPTSWEKDFLRRQMDQPWYDAGTIEWRNGKPSWNLVDVELNIPPQAPSILP